MLENKNNEIWKSEDFHILCASFRLRYDLNWMVFCFLQSKLYLCAWKFASFIIIILSFGRMRMTEIMLKSFSLHIHNLSICGCYHNIARPMILLSFHHELYTAVRNNKSIQQNSCHCFCCCSVNLLQPKMKNIKWLNLWRREVKTCDRVYYYSSTHNVPSYFIIVSMGFECICVRALNVNGK